MWVSVSHRLFSTPSTWIDEALLYAVSRGRERHTHMPVLSLWPLSGWRWNALLKSPWSLPEIWQESVKSYWENVKNGKVWSIGLKVRLLQVLATGWLREAGCWLVGPPPLPNPNFTVIELSHVTLVFSYCHFTPMSEEYFGQNNRQQNWPMARFKLPRVWKKSDGC